MKVTIWSAAAIALGCALIALPHSAKAQPAAPAAPKPEMKENCPGLVADRRGLLPAAFKRAAIGADQVRITYVGHSTFLIESPRLVRIATDYNDYVKPVVLPDVITMNHAHTTHYTNRPDPGIKLVLRGWRDDGKPSDYDVNFEDVRIRSVATNIRDWSGGTQRHGNSVFIFEVANLCIGHLGHLHHTLTQSQLDEIGRLDVVFIPVDGSFTMDIDGMAEVLASIKAPLMVPMHYFSTFTLTRFLDRLKGQYAVDFAETPSMLVSKTSLPAAPTVRVLPGR